MLTVDEEIYRFPPSLVIATADKFAQLPWQGQTRALFGRFTQRCERHGFRSPDLYEIISWSAPEVAIDDAAPGKCRLKAFSEVPTYDM